MASQGTRDGDGYAILSLKKDKVVVELLADFYYRRCSNHLWRYCLHLLLNRLARPLLELADAGRDPLP